MKAKKRIYSPLEHQAYRGYLIRWSIFTLDKPDNRYWIEKSNTAREGHGPHFIAWAQSIDAAKRIIEELS